MLREMQLLLPILVLFLISQRCYCYINSNQSRYSNLTDKSQNAPIGNPKNNGDGSKKELLMTDCLTNCSCNLVAMELTVENCTSNPILALPALLSNHLNITGLNIINSQLSEIPCIISNITNLDHLNLQGNSIETIPWECLHKLFVLHSLRLSFNQIQFLKIVSPFGFASLCKLHLDHNKINRFEMNTSMNSSLLPALEYIDLSFNTLTNLDSWPLVLAQRNANLSLNVIGNSIETFTNDAGRPIITCGRLQKPAFQLQNNNITHYMNIFRGWNINVSTPALLQACLENIDIYLQNNPLTCDCLDYEVYKYMQSSSHKPYRHLTCYKPKDLRGKNPSNIPLDQFICEIYHDCPKNCVCLIDPNQKTVTLKFHGYIDKVLPKAVPRLPGDDFTYILLFATNILKRLTFRPYLKQTSQGGFSFATMEKVTVESLEAFFNASVLHLDHNNLKRLPKNITNVVLPNMKSLQLGNNPWICDCEALPMKDWLTVHIDRIRDKNLVQCNSPPNMTGYNMIAVDRERFCPKIQDNTTAYIIVGAATGGNILLILICLIPWFISKKKFWIYKKMKWHPLDRDECADEGKEFDIFVSYANEDEDYVEEYLIPELEHHGFKVCYHRINFHGGKPITVNIAECIEKSKRTLVFFSTSYKESEFCMWEFSVALEMDLKDKTHRLVTIKEVDLDIEDLEITARSYFKRFTFVRQEAHDFWDHLLYTLPLNRLGSEMVQLDNEN